MNTAKNGPCHGEISSPHPRLLMVDAELRFGRNAVLTSHNGKGELLADPKPGGHPHPSGRGNRLCAPVNLATDSSGGSASDQVAPIAAGESYSQADVVALRNAVATLTAKLNVCLSALQLIGRRFRPPLERPSPVAAAPG